MHPSLWIQFELCSRSRCGTAETVASSVYVEITRNYFGLTVKIHVHFGTFMWVSKSHGSQAWTPRFERIKYDTPFQRHTITEQSYVISCQCWSEKGAKLCNILSMLKRKIGSGGGNRALLRYEFLNSTTIGSEYKRNQQWFMYERVYVYTRLGKVHNERISEES